MIKLFRNIRKKLLTEGKTTNYLKYAIGEIILVVIGILIALQVNNLNELRKERILEKKYLKRFEVELSTSLENILSAVLANKDRIRRAEFLLRAIENPQLAQDSSSYFIKSIEYAGYTNIPLISDNAFEELKSSGNLSIINNVTLRVALQKYYSWTLAQGQYNFIQQDIQLNYSHLRQGIFTNSQVIDMGNYNTSKNYSAIDGKETFERMLNKPEFLEFLPYVIQNKLMAARSYDNIYNQAKTLKTMVKKELGKQKSSKTNDKTL